MSTRKNSQAAREEAAAEYNERVHTAYQKAVKEYEGLVFEGEREALADAASKLTYNKQLVRAVITFQGGSKKLVLEPVPPKKLTWQDMHSHVEVPTWPSPESLRGYMNGFMAGASELNSLKRENERMKRDFDRMASMCPPPPFFFSRMGYPG